MGTTLGRYKETQGSQSADKEDEVDRSGQVSCDPSLSTSPSSSFLHFPEYAFCSKH